MAIFLKGNDLNAALENLFEYAEKNLVLISPYIKLHDRYASTLKAKIDDPYLKIVIVFGKNEEDISKSMKQDDFNFFKEFPNMEIRYEKKLHAKYYANEGAAILTSMNLYNFSQNNNIEAGVLTLRKGFLGKIATNFLTNVAGQDGDSLESDANQYFERVIDQSELLFKKVPQFEKTMFGLSERYTNSEIETDKLSDFFSNKSREISIKKEYVAKPQNIGKIGYCIRTGVQIPFNPNLPMTENAFQSWKKFGNKDYPEKYCHFSGEESKGETSFSKPILRKNWSKAKEIHKI